MMPLYFEDGLVMGARFQSFNCECRALPKSRSLHCARFRSAPVGMTEFWQVFQPGYQRLPLQRILGCHPLAIAARSHTLNPGRVFQIPLDGLANSAFKSLARTPTQFRFNVTDVHGVSA